MFSKLLFSFLVVAFIFVNPLYAGSHASKIVAFMWTRTMEIKPGVSPVAAMKAIRGDLKYVNETIPVANVTIVLV